MKVLFYIVIWSASGAVGYLLGRYPDKAKALWANLKEKFNA